MVRGLLCHNVGLNEQAQEQIWLGGKWRIFSELRMLSIALEMCKLDLPIFHFFLLNIQIFSQEAAS